MKTSAAPISFRNFVLLPAALLWLAQGCSSGTLAETGGASPGLDGGVAPRVDASNSVGHDAGGVVLEDPDPLTFYVTFPTAEAVLGNVKSTRVRGRVFNPDGSEPSAASVTVDGVEATVEGSHWSLSVPVKAGRNTLAVAVTAPVSEQLEVQVYAREPILRTLQTIMAVDGQLIMLLVDDGSQHQLVTIHPETQAAKSLTPDAGSENYRLVDATVVGERLLLLDGRRGNVVELERSPDRLTGLTNIRLSSAFSFDVVTGTDSDVAYVSAADGLHRVDLGSGTTALISGVTSRNLRGVGAPFERLIDLTVLPADNAAYGVDAELGLIFRVDLNTGDRSFVASRGSWVSLAVERGSGEAWALSSDAELGQINLATGEVTEAALDGIPTGANLVSVETLGGEQTVYLTSRAGKHFVRYQPNSGVVEDVLRSRRLESSGPGISVAFLGNRNRVYMNGTWSDSRIFEMDLSQGTVESVASAGTWPSDLVAREPVGILSADTFGDGNLHFHDYFWETSSELEVDFSGNLSGSARLTATPTGSEAFFIDGRDRRVWRIELATGIVNELFDPEPDALATFTQPLSLSISPDASRVYVLDSFLSEIFGVDAATGESTLVSGPTRGEGSLFNGARDIAAGDGVVLVTAGDSIWTIDGETGDRSLLVQAPGRDLRRLALDGEHGRVIVISEASRNNSAALLIDLESGQVATLTE